MLTTLTALDLVLEVHVNTLVLGSVLWPEGKAALSESNKRKLLAKIPLQKQIDVKDIIAAILSLVDNQSITGETLSLDGGQPLAQYHYSIQDSSDHNSHSLFCHRYIFMRLHKFKITHSR